MNSERFAPQPERMEQGVDWFSENPPLQPKAEIAKYIEGSGVPDLKVPERYSLVEGIKLSAIRPVIFRTEHPCEYAGASGVGESVVFGPEDNLLDEVDLLRRLNEKNARAIHEQDSAETSLLSYSAWEVIPGINKTIYRDDTIPNKFHIFARWEEPETKQPCASYTQIENGEVVFMSGDGAVASLTANNILLTGLYEDITSLERFSSTHSSVMEFQESNSEAEPGQHYFLQTHRGREQAEVNFELGEVPEGYVEIQDVRGATPAEGLNVDLLLSFVATRIPNGVEPRSSYGGVDYLQYDQDPRQATVVITKTSLDLLAANHKYSHFNVDILTKPQVTLFPKTKLTLMRDLVTLEADDVTYDYVKDYFEKGKGRINLVDLSTNVQVISDGKKAFLSEPQTLLARFWDSKNEALIELEISPDGSYTER